MAARWLLLHPARVRGGAGTGDAILGVSSLEWGCTVAPSGSAQPQEESHSQRQGEGEEGWAAAEGAHIACGGAWSGGGDSCDHRPLVRLAKGLEKKTRKSGIAPNQSGQQHGVETPPKTPQPSYPGGRKEPGSPQCPFPGRGHGLLSPGRFSFTPHTEITIGFRVFPPPFVVLFLARDF